MALLVYLASRPGDVVPHEDIIREVWRRALVTDAVISQSVYQIRRAFADRGGPARVIDTVPRRGYRLTIAPAPLEAVASGVTAAGVASPAPRRRAVRVALVGACAVVVVAAVAFISLRGRSPDRPSGVPAEARSSEGYAAIPQEPVLLVSPFVAVEQDASPEYLTAGLTEEVINATALIDGLRVLGRSSAARLHAMRAKGEAAASEISLRYELDGTVRRGDARTAVAIHVLDVRDGRTLYQQIYDVADGALGTLPGRIAADLASRLKLATPAFPWGTGNSAPRPEAYRLYLEGRYYSLANTPGGLEQGIDYLQQAAAVDSQFALAHAGLAILHMLQVDFGSQPLDEATKAAEPEARLALALDPELAEAHGARGLIDLYNGSSDEAAAAFRRATSLRPNYTQGHMWLGRLMYQQGNMQRALAAFERAHEIEPLSGIVATNLFLALQASGRLPEARRVAEQNLHLNPGFANGIWAAGMANHLLGNLREALGYYQRAAERASELGNAAGFFTQYAGLLLQLGDVRGADEALRHAEQINPFGIDVQSARLEWELATQAHSRATRVFSSATGQDQVDAVRLVIGARRALQSGRSADALGAYARIGDAGAAILRDRWEGLVGRCGLVDWAAAALEAGDTAQGQALLQEAEALLVQWKRDGMSSGGLDYLQGTVLALRGDKQHALVLLANPAVRFQPGIWWISIDRRLSPLHGQAAFQSLVARAPTRTARLQPAFDD
ncbi:MAG: hypothetical protein NAOJABEB_02671 [Steroidobacteraceae bacterium]|nr:hypothetical protein [Steroidobacteraceae bacterium]